MKFLLLRVVEDYGVIYLGSAVFKIARLLSVAMVSVHLFACIFFRVKVISAAAEEDVAAFYTSKNIAEDVSVFGKKFLVFAILTPWFHILCAGSWKTICQFYSAPISMPAYIEIASNLVVCLLEFCLANSSKL